MTRFHLMEGRKTRKMSIKLQINCIKRADVEIIYYICTQYSLKLYAYDIEQIRR